MINLPQYKMGNHIPKFIHQTHPNKTLLPIEIQENIKKICELNSSWVYCLYDNADIETTILKYYGLEVLNIYRRINPSYGAARADFFRYLLMYAVGGVYLDIKSTITRSLDDVITSDDQYILSKWDNSESGLHPGSGLHDQLAMYEGGEYQQWHIIAALGHPFLRVSIERVIDNIHNYNILRDGVGWVGVLRVTGPITYTLGIETIKSLYPFREIDIRRDLGIEYSIYESLGTRRNHKNIFKKHYTELEIPVIVPQAFRDYYLIFFYYSIKFTRKVDFLYSMLKYIKNLTWK